MSAAAPAAFADLPERAALRPDRQAGTLRFSPVGGLLVAGMLDGTLRRWGMVDPPAADPPAADPASAPPAEAKKPVKPAGGKPPPVGAGPFQEWKRGEGHRGWVQTLVFSPDGKRLWSADSWGTVAVWETAAEAVAPQSTFAAHDGWVRSIALSADGKRLATVGRDRTLRVWDAEAPTHEKPLFEAALGEDLFSVAVHPADGGVVAGDLRGKLHRFAPRDAAAKTYETLPLWDAGSLYMESRLQDVGGVRRLTFDAAGGTLFAAGAAPKGGGNVQGTPTILGFRWPSGERLPTSSFSFGGEGDGFVYDLAPLPGGLLLGVSSGNPGVGKVFGFRPGQAEPALLYTKLPNCHALALHPDGRRIAVASTNGGSNGNGRALKEGEYLGNYSPVALLELPEALLAPPPG